MSQNNQMRPLHPDSVGRETREVTHVLTEDELNDLRTEYVDRSQELSNAEDQFSEQRKSNTAYKKEVKEALKKTMRTIRDGSVVKAVECDLVPDFENNIGRARSYCFYEKTKAI